MTMTTLLFYRSALILIVAIIPVAYPCDIFTGMTCTCYESIDLRCTTSHLTPLSFHSSFRHERTFQSIDLKYPSDEHIQLSADFFRPLNRLFPNASQSPLSITVRFQNFYSFHARSGAFRGVFHGIRTPYSRLTLELHPLKAKSIRFDANTFDQVHLHELSIYADSFSSPFESIFNNTNITHLNIEGAILAHDETLTAAYRGQIQSMKMTRMIDHVNSDEFPSFPVQSYIIEAHKMRSLDAQSFVNYTQLAGLNIIQPDVSLTPQIFQGFESLTNLRTVSLDAERIADGALRAVEHIQTLILGSFLRTIDGDSLNSLHSLRQLDVRYVQFASLQGNTSCLLADFINRRRMTGLTVYLPTENSECDCVLVFLNTMIDDGDQAMKCQSIDHQQCLFSSCSIVSEYFTRKQNELNPNGKVEAPAVVVPIEEEDPTTTMKIFMEANIYDDENEILDEEVEPEETESSTVTSTSTTSIIDFITSAMPKRAVTGQYLIISWIPFAVIASGLFLSLIIAMISYMIYHNRRSISFKLVPQQASMI